MNSRDEFEKFLASKYLCANKTFNEWSENWVYDHSHIEAMWVGWKGAMKLKEQSEQAKLEQFFYEISERYRIATMAHHSIKPR